jgi:Tfp pilus assembly protein PilF
MTAHTRIMGVLVLAATLAGWGCAGPRAAVGPYGAGDAGVRDEVRAAALVDEASEAMPAEPERAKALLREALTADLFQAKAHNNLGVLLLAKGDLYGAAHEFEWARKLLPGHPEPRINLALTLERAGQVREAEASYMSALEVYPGYMPAIQGAARLAVAEGRRSEELARWLDEIAIGGESEAWRSWARARAAELPARR